MVAEVNRWIIQPAVRGFGRLQEHARIAHREVVLFTDATLPAPWNTLAQKICFSLPVAAILFVTPLSIQLHAGLVLYALDLCFGPLEDEHYSTIVRGAFMGYAVRAIVDFSEIRLSCIIYGIGAAILWPHARKSL